jgi:dihydroorotate dehydrogenase (fumarate)
VFDLGTRYMRLELRNPVLVASIGLASTLEGLRRCREAGAAAIVLKSLFEDQITGVRNPQRRREPDSLLWDGTAPLSFIKQAKRIIDIPFIGSLSCSSPEGWSRGAALLEKAGVNGIELNVTPRISSSTRALMAEEKRRGFEEQAVEAVRAAKGSSGLPVAVKLSPYYERIPSLVRHLGDSGADAVVLFNRYRRFDVDIDSLTVSPADQIGSERDFYHPLRWIALLAGRISCDLAASQGIFAAETAIKMLLVGAAVVQLGSAVLVHGVETIGTVIQSMVQWMENHGFTSVSEWRGLLSQQKSRMPGDYERLEYD